MGAYGSPQVGIFANEDKKPQKPKKPKSNLPMILLIIFTIFFLSRKVIFQGIEYFLEFQGIDIMQENIPTRQITDQPIQREKRQTIETHARVMRTGILSNRTGLYMKNDKEIQSDITELISEIVSQKLAGDINIITIQTKTDKIQNKLDTLKTQEVDKEYKDYKTQNCDMYQATLTIIQNCITNNSLSNDNINQISKGFSEEAQNSYNTLKKLFDENGVDYTEIEDGNDKGLHYQYYITP